MKYKRILTISLAVALFANAISLAHVIDKGIYTIDKKHSFGGVFGIGGKVIYKKNNKDTHFECRKCKGCGYEKAISKPHRKDKNGNCKQC